MTLTSWLKYDHEIKKMIIYVNFMHILCIFYTYFIHILCIFYAYLSYKLYNYSKKILYETQQNTKIDQIRRLIGTYI
jgi:hypothetical protein